MCWPGVIKFQVCFILFEANDSVQSVCVVLYQHAHDMEPPMKSGAPLSMDELPASL